MTKTIIKKYRVPLTFAAFVAAFLGVARLRPLVMHDAKTSVITLCISYCLLGCVGVYLFRDRLRDGLIEWKSHPVKSLLWLVGGYIADTVLVTLAYLPQIALFPAYEGMNDSSVAAAMQFIPAPLFIIALGILGPVTEEVVFRFILVDRLKEKVPVALCVIVSSALFMLGHMHALSPQELLINLPIFVSAAVYCVIMLRSKNPTLTILLHVFGNTTALMMLLMNGAA